MLFPADPDVAAENNEITCPPSESDVMCMMVVDRHEVACSSPLVDGNLYCSANPRTFRLMDEFRITQTLTWAEP